jgi:hypothetical protein
MAFNVNDIRSRLTGGGARPNLFKVSMPFPVIAGGDNAAAAEKLTFTCHGAQIPSGDIGSIDIPYFGRSVKMPGNRTFGEWSPNIYNDEDFMIYDSIQAWMNALNSHVTNVRSPNALSSVDYTTAADVTHYAKDGSEIKTVRLINVWPSSLAAIDLDWGTNNQLEEFTCTFQYDYWEAVGLTT